VSPFSRGPLAPPSLLGRQAGSRPSSVSWRGPAEPPVRGPPPPTWAGLAARGPAALAPTPPCVPRAARGRLQQPPPPPLVGPTCKPQPPLSFYPRRTFLSPPSSTSPKSIGAALDVVRLHRLCPFRGEPWLLFFLPSSPPSSPGSAALSPRDVPDPPPLLVRLRRGAQPGHGAAPTKGATRRAGARPWCPARRSSAHLASFPHPEPHLAARCIRGHGARPPTRALPPHSARLAARPTQGPCPGVLARGHGARRGACDAPVRPAVMPKFCIREK
jgi:hypothetical protein